MYSTYFQLFFGSILCFGSLYTERHAESAVYYSFRWFSYFYFGIIAITALCTLVLRQWFFLAMYVAMGGIIMWTWVIPKNDPMQYKIRKNKMWSWVFFIAGISLLAPLAFPQLS